MISTMIALRKAFDSVDHKILMKKLNVAGCYGQNFAWLSSYLSDRRQRTDRRGTLSTPNFVQSGAPQGSVLGPPLFPIFINDLLQSSGDLDICCYADDTTVYAMGSDPQHLVDVMNNRLANVQRWLNDNNLRINAGKCQVMVLRGSTKKFREEMAVGKIMMDDQPIAFVNSTKMLGVTLDSHLTFGEHVRTVQRSTAAGIATLKFLAKDLPHSYAANVMNCFVSSHLEYCCSVWTGTTTSTLEPLRKLQRRALGVVTGCEVTSGDLTKFMEMEILPLDCRWKYVVYNWIFKVLRMDTVKAIRRLLNFREPAFADLRKSLTILCATPKTNVWSRSFTFRACNLLQILPEVLLPVLKSGTLSVFQSCVNSALFGSF